MNQLTLRSTYLILFNIDSAVLSPDMFPSDLFPQLVNFAEQLFLVPGQGFEYVYFAFGSDTKIGEVTSSFLSISFLRFV